MPKEASHDTDRIAAAPPATPYKKLYAYDGSGNLEYEGWAAPSAATSAAAWAIKKNTYTAGNLTSELWADGNTVEDNVWDDRVSLTYA